jgi:hypothetical protein
MWNYLRRRLSIRFALAAALLLPVVSAALLGLRAGRLGAQEFVVFEAGVQESSMVSRFAMAVGAVDSGALELRWGRDLGLAVTWFVPRAWWPNKPFPLDYELSRTLGLASPGEEYGTPIGLFGGLWVQFGIFGLVAGMALLGYGCSFLEARMSTSSFFAVAGRALLFCLLIDITRVGDLSREFGTAGIQFLCLITIVSLVLRRPSPDSVRGIGLGGLRGEIAC